MPCDTVTTQTLSGGLKQAYSEVLRTALTNMGYSVQVQADGSIRATGRTTITWAAGIGIQAQARTSSDTLLKSTIAQVTKEYGKAAVTWAAQRAGWKVQQTGANMLQVTR